MHLFAQTLCLVEVLYLFLYTLGHMSNKYKTEKYPRTYINRSAGQIGMYKCSALLGWARLDVRVFRNDIKRINL